MRSLNKSKGLRSLDTFTKFSPEGFIRPGDTLTHLFTFPSIILRFGLNILGMMSFILQILDLLRFRIIF
jgi:hypothetical protein